MRVLRVNAATKQELLQKSRSSTKGTQRFYRRLFSQIRIPNQAIQTVNVAKWFETDILDAQISVKGETDNYVVTISFWGVWDSYDKSKDLSQENIKKAVYSAYRSQDVYVACTCPDDRYRYAYVATKGRYRAERPEYRPAPITNPRDNLGSGCKHVLLCLMSSVKWIDQLCKITYKYIMRVKNSQRNLYDRFIREWIEREAEPAGTWIIPEVEV
jgi:hypothetical protein